MSSGEKGVIMASSVNTGFKTRQGEMIYFTLGYNISVVKDGKELEFYYGDNGRLATNFIYALREKGVFEWTDIPV